jgi:membrane-bound lytic murein transglycosylase B
MAVAPVRWSILLLLFVVPLFSPEHRTAVPAGAAFLSAAGQTASGDAAPPTQEELTPPPFDEWLAALIAEARARGYGDALIEQTLAGLEPLPHVVRNDRDQAELNPGFDRYLSTRLTARRVADGKKAARLNASLLRRIEKEYGVQRRFILAVWGMETNYGRLTGRTPVFQALATLAWDPRRASYFRDELFNALMMVDRGYIDARTMTGSWAGAMGQTQFMPSSYLQYAVDFDGDGRRDIWKSTPDTLASIANYLRSFGWNDAQTWGREVRVSDALLARIDARIPHRAAGCYAIRNMTERRPLQEWNALGVRRVDGRPLPKADIDASLVDVGERRFLVYPNYDAILGYNCAHYYALTVALLGDTIQGLTPLPRVTRGRRTSASRRDTAHPSARPAPAPGRDARSHRG